MKATDLLTHSLVTMISAYIGTQLRPFSMFRDRKIDFLKRMKDLLLEIEAEINRFSSHIYEYLFPEERLLEKDLGIELTDDDYIRMIKKSAARQRKLIKKFLKISIREHTSRSSFDAPRVMKYIYHIRDVLEVKLDQIESEMDNGVSFDRDMENVKGGIVLSDELELEFELVRTKISEEISYFYSVAEKFHAWSYVCRYRLRKIIIENYNRLIAKIHNKGS